jgi:P27 family predicted phage terminase small subunit
MVGRKRKPSQLKVLQGTFRKDRSNPNEPVIKKALVQAPEHFSSEQVQLWDQIIAEAPKGLLRTLDLGVLETYVVAYVLYREALKKMGASGQVIKTPNGYPQVSPYMANLNKQAVIMLRAAAEMGFTPASRSRVAVIEQNDDDNPWAELLAEG